MLPTIVQCFALWDKYKMPENIREHTRQVARVANAIANHIKAKGLKIDTDLVNRGALLHDIAKIITIGKNDLHHTALGADIVENEGYTHDLANLVKLHGLDDFSFALTLEQQIVNYADKRVRHTEIVPLVDRLSDLKARYRKARKKIEEKLPLFEQFEEKYKLKELRF